jgi:PhzF family phenazine biosynthesis protein
MRVPIYQVDAFTSTVFKGNPAAVCPLERWPDDAILQAIAEENNLSETAFFVARGDDFDLRWFTPKCEVDLCGHATLASAFVVFEFLDRGSSRVTFHSRSGPLIVARDGELLAMEFPTRAPERCDPPAALVAGLEKDPIETWRSRDLMAVFESEEDVRALAPRMELLLRLDVLGVIATAPGRDADFVSRFFAPAAGVPEDPVTGSAHCTLIPYWAGRLGRPRLHARQISARGGELFCEHRGERVIIAGRAALYLEGTIRV